MLSDFETAVSEEAGQERDCIQLCSKGQVI